MGGVLASLLPLIIGAAVVPVWIILILLLLRGEGGMSKAALFTAGGILVRLAQGVVFGFVFGASADTYGETGANLIASTLLMVIGILLLIAAVFKWRKEEDPDAPPPKWSTALGGLSPGRAFGAGVLLTLVAVKQWVFTLSAISVIEASSLSQNRMILLYLIFVVGATSLMLIPILICLVLPGQSQRLLEQAQGLLERYNRPIVVTVSVVFGVFFLWKGISGLVG
jgi:threonine/homoserine/homoserine lactone efflux protein